MTDLPRKAVVRTARLATLPLGVGARAAVGLGKRVGGKPAEAVAQAMQEQTAQQLFKVLGELKGGAMKVGQGLSIFEAALPDEIAAPYREMLTKLQDSAPAMPTRTMHGVMRAELGTRWRSKFESFDDTPVAAASIGQVHRAIWKDGRDVAVKVQYPGAAEALMSDVKQLSLALRVATAWMPGPDLGPILSEVRARMSEETDYVSESVMQQQFADAYADSDHVRVPSVIAATERVIVSEWVNGTPLSRIIKQGTASQRDLAAERYLEFLLDAPRIAGLLHADPHPGNFRLLDDGRLGVLDFGAVNRLPDGLPPSLGRVAAAVVDEDPDQLEQALREAGFVRPSVRVDASGLLGYLGVFAAPLQEETFTFTRAWLRSVFTSLNDPRSSHFGVNFKLNLPPEYVLIHRAWLGGIAVLCQIEGTTHARELFAGAVPGYEGE